MHFIKEEEKRDIKTEDLKAIIDRINKLIKSFHNLEKVEAGCNYFSKEYETYEPYLSVVLTNDLENIQIGFKDYETWVSISVPAGQEEGISYDIPKEEKNSKEEFLSAIKYEVKRYKVAKNLGFLITADVPSREIQFYLNLYLTDIKPYS